MKPKISHFSLLFAVVAVFSGVISFPIYTLIVAQTNCPPGDTPATLQQSTAWSRNAVVNVNINSNQFTQAQFNCLNAAFTNWNQANGVAGNGSGVTFNVTYSPNAVATVQTFPNGQQGAVSSPGVTNGFQVNSRDFGEAGSAGVTY